MKLYELVSETFEPHFRAEPEISTEGMYTAKEKIGDRIISCTGQLLDPASDTWSVDFKEVDGGRKTYQRTGSGQSMQVISFVIDCLRDITERYHPAAIEFSADKGSGGISKLYQRIAQREHLLPGYRLANITDLGNEDIITIQRIDLDEAFDLKRSLSAGLLGTALAFGGDKALNTYNFKPERPPKTTVSPSKKETNFDILKNALNKAGVEFEDIIHLFAQGAAETGKFTQLTEPNGKYMDIKVNPKKAKRLGNIYPGDGHKFRGRGFIQLTGRYNYELLNKALNDPNINLIENPDLAADPYIAAKIAVWWYQNKIKPSIKNKQPSVKDFTKTINPGLKGLKQREKYYNEFKNEFKKDS